MCVIYIYIYIYIYIHICVYIYIYIYIYIYSVLMFGAVAWRCLRNPLFVGRPRDAQVTKQGLRSAFQGGRRSAVCLFVSEPC